MKHLKESIFNDVEDIVNNDTILIEQFLKDNYKITGSYIIKDGVVDVKGDVHVKNANIESLTNGMFQFGNVTRGFYCSACKNITSLKGAPKEVGGNFFCTNCDNLISLEGAPRKVGRSFWCNNCPNLVSLEGAPIEVGGGFDCDDCCIPVNVIKFIK